MELVNSPPPQLRAQGVFTPEGTPNLNGLSPAPQPHFPPALHEMCFMKAQLRIAGRPFEPSITKRRAPVELDQYQDVKVADWSQVKRHKLTRMRPISVPTMQRVVHNKDTSLMRHPMQKATKSLKSKSAGGGRQYTSKYRGVHQTFPTRRWEAQFRRAGKPTSLGCFDREEEAARAYDKMMMWCDIHNTAGVKGGITNFDQTEYDKEVAWLQQISQDELIEQLRSDGRKQAAKRMLKQKREVIHGADDGDSGEGPLGVG